MVKKRAYNWILRFASYIYISLVVASCMVLYGYDASIFNTVQVSTNWLNWFGFNSKKPVGRHQCTAQFGELWPSLGSECFGLYQYSLHRRRHRRRVLPWWPHCRLCWPEGRYVRWRFPRHYRDFHANLCALSEYRVLHRWSCSYRTEPGYRLKYGKLKCFKIISLCCKAAGPIYIGELATPGDPW